MAADDDDIWTEYEARGRAVRERYVGKVEQARSASEELIPGISKISDDANWGAIWARPGLDLKVRSISIICVLVSLGRFKYAVSHIRGARRLGVTRTELAEAMFQLTFYAGLAAAHEGLALVKQVFDEPAET